MNTDAHIIQLVEAYLDGSLSEPERSEFEERYASDKDFASEADAWARQIKMVQLHGETSLNQSLKNRFAHQPQANSNNYRRIGLLAAVAAILLLAGIFMGRALLSDPSMPEMYADHFSAPSFATRGGQEVDNDRLWREASVFYHQQDYRQAAAMLETLVTQTAFSHVSEGYLCLGVCYLKLETPQKALDAFSKVKPGSVFVQNAQWYSLLSFLQMEDREAAIEAANVILEIDHHYKSKETAAILKVLM